MDNNFGSPAPLDPGCVYPRDGRASTDFTMRMRPEAHAGLTPVAQYVLNLHMGLRRDPWNYRALHLEIPSSPKEQKRALK